MPNIHLNATKLWDKPHTHSASSNRTITNFINKHICYNDKEKIFNHYEEEYNAMYPFNQSYLKIQMYMLMLNVQHINGCISNEMIIIINGTTTTK
jgi:hypothetical protein